jgi:hypothetical protein
MFGLYAIKILIDIFCCQVFHGMYIVSHKMHWLQVTYILPNFHPKFFIDNNFHPILEHNVSHLNKLHCMKKELDCIH